MTIAISSSGLKRLNFGIRLGGKGCKSLAFGSAGWNLSTGDGISAVTVAEEEANGREGARDRKFGVINALRRTGRLAVIMRLVMLETGEAIREK